MENYINKVIQGDCLEVMKGIPDKSVDMILADLPYGTTACKWDTIIPFEPLWEQYKRIIKDNGAIVLTASQPFTSALVMSNIKMFKYEMIWYKDRPTGLFTAKIQPMKYHENILVFGSSKVVYNPEMWIGEKNHSNLGKNKSISSHYNSKFSIPKTDGLKNPKSIIYCQREHPPVHPTQKPVALFEYLIKTYTNEGNIVLDNVAGSGTTGVACKNTNRNYILIEKEPEYIEIINKRLSHEKEF
jgi:site-specific DNA-methyltransferase (adenine-specific)